MRDPLPDRNRWLRTRGPRPAGQPLSSDTAEPALKLSPEEAELVAAEATAAGEALEGAGRRHALHLAAEARTGQLNDDVLEALATILNASLQGGRARHLYKAEGERILTRLLARTPAGREHQDQLDAVNRALGALGGRRLDKASVAMRSPGRYTVSLQTEGISLVLAVHLNGVTVESLSG